MDFFKRHFSVALFAVLGLVLVAYIGARGNLQIIFGVVVPYLAILLFVEGFVYRLITWARSPYPSGFPPPPPRAGPSPGSKGTWEPDSTTRRPLKTSWAAWPWKFSPSGVSSVTCAPNCARTR